MTELERKDAHLVDRDALGDEDHRAYQAYLLRQAGHDWVFVAEETGYANAGTAEVSVRKYLQTTALSLSQEQRMEILQLQTDRLERLIASQWHQAMAGDTKAADFCLKAIAQLTRTYGLDELHAKQGQSTKTIVVAGTPEQYTAALQAIVEE